LIDPVFEEENFLGFGLAISTSEASEVSLTNAPRESRRKQGGSDEQ
jgi:exosome complex RNA-binding protein Rrp42 (RNase PH superfamily)